MTYPFSRSSWRPTDDGVHLGGPESHEKLIERQASYETLWPLARAEFSDRGRGHGQGSAGSSYWGAVLDGEEVYETAGP